MIGGWILPLPGRLRGLKRDSTKEAEAETTGGGDDDPDPLVTVLTLMAAEAMAIVIAERLQDEGIPTYIRREPGSGAMPLIVGPLGRIDIMVPKLMEEKARELIEALLGEDDPRLAD